MKTILLTAAASLVGLTGVASAESIAVSAGIPAYCDVSLANGSSNTVSIAMEATQTLANFDVACNAGGGAELRLEVSNADFQHATNSNILVNYAAELRSPELPALGIAERDFSPGPGQVATTSAPYSSTLAGGVAVSLWVNMNVDAPGPTANGQTWFRATNAPAGTYNETFALTVSAL